MALGAPRRSAQIALVAYVWLALAAPTCATLAVVRGDQVLESGNTIPLYSFWGQQSGTVERRLALWTAARRAAYCVEVDRFMDEPSLLPQIQESPIAAELKGSLVLMTSWGHICDNAPISLEIAALFPCLLLDIDILQVDENNAYFGFWAHSHDGTRFQAYYARYPEMRPCLQAQTIRTPSVSRIEEALLKANSTQPVLGTLRLEPNPFREMFLIVPLRVLFQGVFGVAFLAVAGLAIAFYRIKLRRQRKSRFPWPHKVVLMVNSVSMSLVAIVLFLDGNMFVALYHDGIRNAHRTLFFGTSTGLQVILASQWSQLVRQSKRGTLMAHVAGAKPPRPAPFARLGFLLLFSDLFIILFQSFLLGGTDTFAIASVVLALIQIAVIIYLLQSTAGVLRLLATSAIGVEAPARHPMEHIVAAQQTLLRRLARWTRISAFSAMISVLAFVLAALGVASRSPEGYVVVTFSIHLGKLLNGLAQVYFCQPPPDHSASKSAMMSKAPSGRAQASPANLMRARSTAASAARTTFMSTTEASPGTPNGKQGS